MSEDKPFIVSLSGRKGSGKGEIASLLVSQGFEKISFADTLKELVCELYNWDLQKLGFLDYKEERLKVPVTWDETTAEKLSSLIKPHFPVTCEEPKTFLSRREVLQYIGTDVLRKADSNFHIASLIKKIKPGKKYVLDDVRFLNELAAMKQLDAICLYVIRPSELEYSNHGSEIGVSRLDVPYTLVNNVDKSKFIDAVSTMFSSLFAGNFPDTNDIVKYSKETETPLSLPTEYSANLAGIISSTCDVKISDSSLSFIVYNDKMAKYICKELNIDDTTILQQGKKSIINIDSPYIFEDLKLWELINTNNATIVIPRVLVDLQNINYIQAWCEPFMSLIRIFKSETRRANESN